LPSVLLLIGTGICIKYLARYYGYVEQDVMTLVKVLGAVGLIMIVLEAALDLKINRKKTSLIRNSFFSAFIISAISMLSIGWLITYWLGESFGHSILYAIPMSIISSAIVIPSTEHLPVFKKEFVVYESSFSDILGILAFNYIVAKEALSISSGFSFMGSIALAIGIAIAASLLLTYMLSHIKINLKFFLIFSILSMVYAMGEMIHLPSLLIVLVFGLVFNNPDLFSKGVLKRIMGPDNNGETLLLLKSLTAETSFLIRTFFFILFGYTIQLSVLLVPIVWELGTAIVLCILLIRFLYLRFILRANLFPELLLVPRGLVTILLFYRIPPDKVLRNFNVGILFYVIVLTSVLMTIGLLFFKDKRQSLLSGNEEGG
jgi:hypothetical protein